MKLSSSKAKRLSLAVFYEEITCFFRIKSIKDHLLCLEDCLNIISNIESKMTILSSDLHSFYSLFEACSQLIQAKDTALRKIKAALKINSDICNTEKKNITFYPRYLTDKEIQQPLKAIKSVFKTNNLIYHKSGYKEWFNNNEGIGTEASFLPIYRNTKKLIEACWLIHERLISKNSFNTASEADALAKYALTAPCLFTEEESNQPFLSVESFFNFTNLSGYRSELKEWYMMAITSHLTTENPNDSFFIYNQYLSLIQAGYFISTKNLFYVPIKCKSKKQTLGEWLLEVRNRKIREGKLSLSDEMPKLLSATESAKPLDYIKKTLTPTYVTQLRFGLKEWLESSFSENSSINELDPLYTFEQYQTLQKITEAFYLILIGNTNHQVLPLTLVNHEA